MGSCIDEVRHRLNNLLDHLAASSAGPRTLVGVASYRDHPPQDVSYVTRWLPLGAAGDAENFLEKTDADGGGDDPEALIDGLLEGIERPDWRQRSLRILIVVSDAPPHGMGDVGDGFPSGCPCERNLDDVIAAAKRSSVRLFTVAVGKHRFLPRILASLAQATDGQYTTVDRLSSLIDPILELLDSEMASLDDELALLRDLSIGLTPREAAAASGRSSDLTVTAVARLREKHAITPIANQNTEVGQPAAPWWKERASSSPPSSPVDFQTQPTRDWWRERTK